MENKAFTGENRKGREEGLHYAWIILLSCCVLSGACLGIVINCKGLFFAPVCRSLGWRVSSFTVYTVFYGLAAFFTLFKVDVIFARCPIRPLLTGMLVLFCGSTALMGTFSSLPQFYFAGALQGISGAFLLYVPVPMLLSHWFVKRRGLALGISALSSGIFGAAMNPILSAVITGFGWRSGYAVQGAAAFLLAFPFTLFVIVSHPEDMGLKAYGEDEIPGIADAVPDGKAGGQGDPGKSSKRPHPRRFVPVHHEAEPAEDRGGFVICVIFAAVFTFCASYAQQLANFASSIGLPAAAGAFMVSCCMFGNILTKTVIGAGCDSIGARKTATVSISLVGLGFILLGLNSGGGAGMYAGAFLLGVDHANMTVLVPISVARVAGRTQYDHVISRTTMSTMLTSAFSSVLISSFYDHFGSYRIIFLAAAFLQVLCLVLAQYLFRTRPMR